MYKDSKSQSPTPETGLLAQHQTSPKGNFLGFESGVAGVSAAGWPATADGWAIVGGQEQGGVKGWFRSMAIPRRWVGKT